VHNRISPFLCPGNTPARTRPLSGQKDGLHAERPRPRAWATQTSETRLWLPTGQKGGSNLWVSQKLSGIVPAVLATAVPVAVLHYGIGSLLFVMRGYFNAKTARCCLRHGRVLGSGICVSYFDGGNRVWFRSVGPARLSSPATRKGPGCLETRAPATRPKERQTLRVTRGQAPGATRVPGFVIHDSDALNLAMRRLCDAVGVSLGSATYC
jgi:hypothetical protein